MFGLRGVSDVLWDGLRARAVAVKERAQQQGYDAGVRYLTQVISMLDENRAKASTLSDQQQEMFYNRINNSINTWEEKMGEPSTAASSTFTPPPKPAAATAVTSAADGQAYQAPGFFSRKTFGIPNPVLVVGGVALGGFLFWKFR